MKIWKLLIEGYKEMSFLSEESAKKTGVLITSNPLIKVNSFKIQETKETKETKDNQYEVFT